MFQRHCPNCLTAIPRISPEMAPLRDAYPINVLNQVKNCPEVCRIFCATANPLQVLVAATQGRGIAGVVDGFSPKGWKRTRTGRSGGSCCAGSGTSGEA